MNSSQTARSHRTGTPVQHYIAPGELRLYSGLPTGFSSRDPDEPATGFPSSSQLRFAYELSKALAKYLHANRFSPHHYIEFTRTGPNFYVYDENRFIAVRVIPTERVGGWSVKAFLMQSSRYTTQMRAELFWFKSRAEAVRAGYRLVRDWFKKGQFGEPLSRSENLPDHSNTQDRKR